MQGWVHNSFRRHRRRVCGGHCLRCAAGSRFKDFGQHRRRRRTQFLKSGIFWADYGDLDISRVDPALLVVPALGAVLPVSFAAGVPVVVDSVDADFADAAAALAPVWAEMYPTFASGSQFSLLGRRVPAGRPVTGNGALLLYSGGVDSVTSLLKNKDIVHGLLSVWGADIPLENELVWRQLSALTAKGQLTKDLPRLPSERTHATSSSIIGLSTTSSHRAVIGGAWKGAAFTEPWGSSPTTDNLVRWTGTTVLHDSFELSRQDKLSRHIAPYLQGGGQLDLAVCYQPGRGADGVNCGRCEKCLRTATGLLAAGADPESAGLPIAPGGYDSWRSATSRR